MIGDWVGYDEYYGKILVIGASDVLVYVPDREESWFTSYSRLEQIPITPEILEKNDFLHFHPENRKAEYWQIYVNGGDVNVKITYGRFRFRIYGKPLMDGSYCPCFNGHLVYVHELQHALRLCGIEKEIEL